MNTDLVIGKLYDVHNPELNNPLYYDEGIEGTPDFYSWD